MTIELKPEQERILREAIRQGRFESLEQALDEALQSIVVPSHAESRAKAAKKSLVELFAPLRGLELDFNRNPSTGRPLEL